MFHKIEKLTSIGKFRDFSAHGDIAFKPLTVIYAENGSGKTTLAAIFRSIATNNPSLISKRVSTNSTLPQMAQIHHRSDLADPTTQTTITYRRNAWSTGNTNIEVFDVHFISENVYSGFEFTNDQRKQLHHFIVGAQGILIKQQIEQNKEDRRQLNERMTENKNQLITNVGNGLNETGLRAFYSLIAHDAEDIDNKIAVAETHFENAKQHRIIQSLQLLQNINLVSLDIDFEQIKSDIQTAVDTIKDNTLSELFKSHCEDLRSSGISQPENWAKVGYTYFQNNVSHQHATNCPFCTQPISNTLDIIKAYTQQFNDTFNAYLERLRIHLEKLTSLNIDTLLQTQLAIINSNEERAELWRPLLGEGNVVVSNTVTPNIDIIKEEVNNTISILRTKLQNPTVSIEVASLQAIAAHIININSLIETYNENINSINRNAQNFKAGIQLEQNAELELQKLKRIKARFEAANVALVTQISADKQRLTTLESTYSTLVAQEEADAQSFLTQYAARINHYLSNIFHTPFTIQTMAHVRPVGRAIESRVGYELTIDGHIIQFDTFQPNSVKECFSDGDRNTVALAFFLAKLDIDPNRRDKIVIFDDPLSSHDTHRRGYTVEIIKSLVGTVKQVIVLSHNEFFLHDIYSRCTSEKKSLALTVNATQNSSSISPVDLNDMVDTSYFRNVRVLERFLTSGNIADKDYVRGLIRVVIEAKLKFNFYRALNTLPEASRTFGRIITTLETISVVFRDAANTQSTYAKLKELNGMSWVPHHGDPEPEMVTQGYNSASMPISELQNYVIDTLDLIQNKI